MRRELFQNNWLLYLSLGYLLLPFAIFCLTFLRIWIGLPIVIILIWIVIRIWIQRDASQISFKVGKSDLIIGLVVLGVWVFLSGIGGFAFQNSDHHIRNAIFKDLILNNWPVYYPQAISSPTSPSYALIYYIGYWLPAALSGKILGWQGANVFLFGWTWLGIFITAALIKDRIKTTLTWSALLLIFFGGMDFLGALVLQPILHENYPHLWPPITHLEWWAPHLQFSSFTTQLFWVFNQALPAWICIALILNGVNRRYVFFILSLCFFLSPIPALGLLPFTLLAIPQKLFNTKNMSFKWRDRKIATLLKDSLSDIYNTISPENILGGGLVFITSYLYFSTNPSGSRMGFFAINLTTVFLLLIFLAYEGILLWLLFFNEQRNNLWWYVTGGTLVITPLILVGSSIDFSRRASIPALFVLMIFSGEALFRKTKVKYRGALILLLAIGAITSLYEINRSIYRTVAYYLQIQPKVEESTYYGGVELPNPIPELDHPSTLTADLYPSLSVFNPQDIPNFVGVTNYSFFFKYLAKPP